MKKLFIFIIWVFSISGWSHADFWSPSSLDLYKNVDSWILELEEKMLEFDANWGIKQSTILKEINHLARVEKKPACLDESKSLSIKEFSSIVLEKNVELIARNIDQTCALENGWVTVPLLYEYHKLFELHYQNSKQKSEQKTGQIYNLSKIWLYSDGISENSWFDLLVDIEEIDKIAFTYDNDFTWEDDVDINDSVDSLLENVSSRFTNQDGFLNNLKNDVDDSFWWDYGSLRDLAWNGITTTHLNEFTSDQKLELSSNFACTGSDSESSWLSPESLEEIKNYLASTPQNNAQNNTSDTTNNGTNWEWNNGWNDSESDSWWYEEVKDNETWPCNDFFCINIDFQEYEHNLFGWWDNPSIEFLVNRSNEHLEKFAASSLIQSKMAINQFEIWLKDLNFPDIFHMWFQVSTKPIPILNLEEQEKKDETEFAAKNIIEAYYEANGLDIKRRNDLTLLRSAAQDKQSILNSEELTIGNPTLKYSEYYNDYLKNEQKRVALLNKSVDKKVTDGVMETFQDQYIEIDKFAVSINQYIENLYSILKKMREIPIDKW